MMRAVSRMFSAVWDVPSSGMPAGGMVRRNRGAGAPAVLGGVSLAVMILATHTAAPSAAAPPAAATPADAPPAAATPADVPPSAATPAEKRVFTIADGGFSLSAPEGWQRVRPKSGIVETEFSIPGGDDAAAAGRMTVMGAGGSVADNISRWYGQFSQPDGSATKDRATTKTLKIAGCDVTIVDVAGTYKDMPGGPFAGGAAIERPNYRMLAAIVETPRGSREFLKFYGPAATVGAHADGFRSMVEGMVAAGR
jgi:hypothetical protein